MFNTYTFNGFAPRTMSMVAAGARRNNERDGASAHSFGSSVDPSVGVGASLGSINNMDTNANLHPEKGRFNIVESKQLGAEHNTMRDNGTTLRKLLLRSTNGEKIIDLTGEVIADRFKEVIAGQNSVHARYVYCVTISPTVTNFTVGSWAVGGFGVVLGV